MSKMHKLLVVGLGNLPFPSTRHSIGHLIVENLATLLGARLSYDANLTGHHGRAQLNTKYRCQVALFKSEQLMNVSGPSIAKMIRRSVKVPESMVVIHDSLYHDVEEISARFGGTANGHNGIKSIIEAVQTADFYRLRIGIGKNGDIDAAEYVLQRLSNFEQQFWAVDGPGLQLLLRQIEKIAANARVDK